MTAADTKSSKKKKKAGKKAKEKEPKVKKSKAKKEAAGKKEKTKKSASKANGTKGAGGRASPRGDKKITVVEKKPPVKAGSKRAAMFDAAKSAKTVSDYLAAGGTSKFLDAMLEKGWVKLS